MEPSTARFQQALPYLLLPVSAPLSALHSRPCPQNPDLCSCCGAYLHTGASRSRLLRTGHARVLHTTCLVCSHVRTTPLDRYSSTRQVLSAADPDSGDNIPSTVSSPQPNPSRKDNRPRESVAPSSSANPQTPRSAAARGKVAQSSSRSKKKTGLQAMLARNREQQNNPSNQTEHQGLSAFLNGL